MSDSNSTLTKVKLDRTYEVTLPPIFVPKSVEPLHVLHTPWAIWAQKKVKRNHAAGGSWLEGTVCLGRFDTVEGFWQLYSHLLRADSIVGSADVMLFRDGINPVWEDPANKAGGKWTLQRMRKAGAAQVWEELVLAMVGEAFEGSTDVCGAILHVRFHDENHLAVWHRSADHDALSGKLR
jgi:translation initiation factor 4E